MHTVGCCSVDCGACGDAGVLVFVGMAGIAHTQLYRRCVALLQNKETVERHWAGGGKSSATRLSRGRVHLFTSIQASSTANYYIIA
jgi:hypothetical protein